MSDNEQVNSEVRRRMSDSESSEDEGPEQMSRKSSILEDSTPTSTSSAPKVDKASDDEDTEDEAPEDVEAEEKCRTHNHNLVLNGQQDEDEEDEVEEDRVEEDEEVNEVSRKEAESSDTEEEEEEEEEEHEEHEAKQEKQVEEEEEEEEEEIKEITNKVAEAEIERSPSPEDRSRSGSPEDRSRSVSPDVADSGAAERKSSHGSSSYDERASSMSPEPAQVISTPHSAAAAAGKSSSQSAKDITKIYTEALVNEKPSVPGLSGLIDKPRGKLGAGGDITQIYTASLVQKEQQSPKLERARGGKPVKDITQLYTAAFMKPEKVDEMPSPNRPRRNDNITKLYTGGFADSAGFKSKPNDEITNPRKHKMATSLDKEGIRDAYSQVMGDNNGVEWAVFKFDEQNQLGVSGTGTEFAEFKSHFGSEERGFGYIKIQTGDEMSKRARFVLITWVGSGVSVMKKAKMSTDRLLVKEIVQNLSVELQLESSHELNLDHLKAEVDKAGGARYGTGVRDM